MPEGLDSTEAGILQTQKELGRNPARLDMSGYPQAGALGTRDPFIMSILLLHLGRQSTLRKKVSWPQHASSAVQQR